MISTIYLVKTLHRLSYSVFLIAFFCKDFLYNLSKDLTVCLSLSYGFLYLLYLFIIILCNILLPKDRVQAIPADIGKIIKPKPVTDKVIEVDVAAMITVLSIDSKTVFRVFYFFLFLFRFVVFIFEICNHFFNFINMVIKTI